MKQSDADEIWDLLKNNKKIDAIRVLRMHSHMDLIASKNYLELPNLMTRLQHDFVMGTNEELLRARRELNRLSARVKDLEHLEGLEHEETTAERASYVAMTKWEMSMVHDAIGFMIDVADEGEEPYYLDASQREKARDLRDRLVARSRMMRN